MENQTPDPDPLSGVHIGAREIYDVVTAVRSDVLVLRAQTDDVRAKIAEHDAKLSDLDRWRYGLPVAAISGVGGMILSVLKSTGVA